MDKINDKKFTFMMASMNNKELEWYVVEKFKDKKKTTKDKLNALNDAIKFGLNINEGMLFYAVDHNEFAIVAALINLGVDIHHKLSNGDNIVSHSVLCNRPEMLKFFLKKGVNVNDINEDNDTPIYYACRDNYFECMEILLNDDNIIIDPYDEKNNDIEEKCMYGNTFELVLKKMMIDMRETSENDKKKYCEFFSKFVEKKQILRRHDMIGIKNAVINDRIDIIKNVCNKFDLDDPMHVADNNNTMLFVAMKKNKYMIASYLIEKLENNHNYINMVQEIDNPVYIEQLLKKKKINEYVCKTKCKMCKRYADKSFTETLMNSTYNKSNDFVNKTLQILVTNGYNIKNDKCILNNAIQYKNLNIVKNVIELGAKQHGDVIKFAIKMNKLDMVMYLIEKKMALNYVLIDKKYVFVGLLTAVKYNRDKILECLINLPQINCDYDTTTKNILFNYALKNGTSKNMYKYFTTSEMNLKMLDMNINDIQIKKYKEYLHKKILSYDEFSMTILDIFKNISLILKYSCHISMTNIYDVLEYTNNLYDDIEQIDVNIHKLLFMIGEKIDYFDITILNKCISIICGIEGMHTCYDCKLKYTIKIQKIASNYKDKLVNIDNFIKIIDKLRTDEISLKMSEIENKTIVKSVVDLSNKDVKQKNINEDYNIKKKLFKLYWPCTVDHYDFMYNNLANNKDNIISVNQKELVIVEHLTNIRSVILKIKSKKPSKWIKTYAQNIGHEKKNDPYHRFSFKLDEILLEWPCIEQIVPDPTSKNGFNTLIYFYGILKNGNSIETGCYEYFLNNKQTLFHRFFRSFANLPIDIKKTLNNLTQ